MSGKTRDPVVAARKVFDHLIAKYDPDADSPQVIAPQGKDTKAQAAGKLGGLKGGKARAAKLSGTKRKEIASNAAKARWKRSPKLNPS
jgi:hypothetical protein